MSFKVNDHVNLQWSKNLWDLNRWFLLNKFKTWLIKLYPFQITLFTLSSCHVLCFFITDKIFGFLSFLFLYTVVYFSLLFKCFFFSNSFFMYSKFNVKTKQKNIVFFYLDLFIVIENNSPLNKKESNELSKLEIIKDILLYLFFLFL